MAERARQGSFKIPPLVGGINDWVSPHFIADNELLIGRNTDFISNIGSIQKRAGTSLWGTITGAGGNRVTGLHWPFNGSLVYAIASNGRFYSLPLAGGTATQIATGIGTANHSYFVDVIQNTQVLTKNKTNGQDEWVTTSNTVLYFIAGGTPYYYNPTTGLLRSMGFPAPTGTVSGADGGAGNLNGTYYWRVSFLYGDDASESTRGPASGSMSVTNRKVDLTGIPVGASGTGVTARILYRTVAGGNQYFYLTKINDNTTTTYTDNIADAGLGTEEAPSDNGIPPNGAEIMVKVGERIFMAKDNTVYWSAITVDELGSLGLGGDYHHGAHHEIFPTFHRWNYDRKVTALIPFKGNVVVFTEYGFYLLIGRLSNEMDSLEMSGEYGTNAPKSVVEIDGALYFWSMYPRPGFYIFRGARPEPIFDKISSTVLNNIRLTDASRMQAIKWLWFYIVFYPDATNNVNINALVYDTKAKRWIEYRGGLASGNAFYASTVINDSAQPTDFIRLLVGQDIISGAADLRILRLLDPNQNVDYGNANITMTVKTKFFPLNTENVKRMGRIRLYADGNASATITVARYYDYETTASRSTTFTLAPGRSLDTATPVNDGSDMAKKTITCNEDEVGHVVSLEITSSDNQRPIIHELNLHYMDMGIIDPS